MTIKNLLAPAEAGAARSGEQRPHGRCETNILIAIGAYTCGRWSAMVLGVVLQHGIRLLIARRGVGSGDMLVRALVTSLPDAMGAALSGVATAWLVDSRNPGRWVMLTAACWMLLFVEDALVRAPTWIDVLMQTAIAALPAIVCIGAGRMAIWHRERR